MPPTWPAKAQDYFVCHSCTHKIIQIWYRLGLRTNFSNFSNCLSVRTGSTSNYGLPVGKFPGTFEMGPKTDWMLEGCDTIKIARIYKKRRQFQNILGISKLTAVI